MGCRPHYGRKTVRMEGTLIAFSLTKYVRDKASGLVKRLHGQATSSHGGKCEYRRKGLLDEIPHRRLIRGVVVMRTEDVGRVVRLLEEIGAEVCARKVELTAKDAEAMEVGDREGRRNPQALPRSQHGCANAPRRGDAQGLYAQKAHTQYAWGPARSPSPTTHTKASRPRSGPGNRSATSSAALRVADP